MNPIGIVLNAVILILVLILFPTVRSYFSEKGKNLATKDDVAKITDMIEKVRTKHTAELEKMKAVVLTKANIHQIRFEKEYGILSELAEKLVQFRDSAMGLRPVLDSYDPQEPKEGRFKKRATRYMEAGKSFYSTYEARRPFYPDDLYDKLKVFQDVAWKEFVDYETGQLYGQDAEYWKRARESIETIAGASDAALESIKLRIKYWEDLDLGETKIGDTG